MERTEATEAAAALDTEVSVVRVVDITEKELLSEFAQVMHEWSFRPFREGKVRMPLLVEARLALMTSPYTVHSSR